MTHYYFSKGKLYEIDRMPPSKPDWEKYLRSDGTYGPSSERQYNADMGNYNMNLSAFSAYLSTLQPIPCERFTQEGVYPADRIEWRYEVKLRDKWEEFSKEGFEQATASYPRRRVAVLKEPELNTSDNWYHKIYPKGELVIMDPDGWDRVNWHHSWYVDMITKEEFERRVAMSTVMMQAIKSPAPSLDSPEPTAGPFEETATSLSELIRTLSRAINRFPDFFSDTDKDRFKRAQEVQSKYADNTSPRVVQSQPPVPKTAGDAAMTPQSILDENFKGLDDAIGDSDLSDWYKRLIVTCLEGYGSHCVIQYKSETENEQPQLPKTDEEAAEKYAESHLSSSGWDAQAYVKHNAFLAGCQHVRLQQVDAVAFAEWIAKNDWVLEIVNNQAMAWDASVGVTGKSIPISDLYALFTSRPGNLQQGKSQDELWNAIGELIKDKWMLKGTKDHLKQHYHITPKNTAS